MSCSNSDVPHDGNAELMRRIAGGDREAFVCLYGRFGPKLRELFTGSSVNSHLCEDLVQKIFTDLWERRTEYREQLSFEAYLFAVARNTLNKELRVARRLAGMDLPSHPDYPGDSYHSLSEPEAELYLKEIAGAIGEARCKLTRGQRQALDAFLAGDNCSREPQKSQLKRARKRMRRLLASFLDDEIDSDKS